MDLSIDSIKELRELKQNLDSDDIRIKEIIKKKLLENDKIIYVLNNKELQETDAEADEYYGINILPYYMIRPTQSNVQNYICYEVGYDEVNDYNKVVKYQEITFYILCEQKNIIDESTYIARHDLLAALIINQFNWTNFFGQRIHCVSNKPSIVDTDYACRTLVFEQITDNGLTKTINKVPRTVNKEIHI